MAAVSASLSLLFTEMLLYSVQQWVDCEDQLNFDLGDFSPDILITSECSGELQLCSYPIYV